MEMQNHGMLLKSHRAQDKNSTAVLMKSFKGTSLQNTWTIDYPCALSCQLSSSNSSSSYGGTGGRSTQTGPCHSCCSTPTEWLSTLCSGMSSSSYHDSLLTACRKHQRCYSLGLHPATFLQIYQSKVGFWL